MIYRIAVQGVLDQSWSDWLNGVDIHTESSEDCRVVTTLTGDLMDQATLFGILDHIRDLNLELISVHRQEKPETGEGKDE